MEDLLITIVMIMYIILCIVIVKKDQAIRLISGSLFMYMEKKNYHCIDCGKKITEDEYIEYGGSCKECHTFWINH